jgi:hypothetical protein
MIASPGLLRRNLLLAAAAAQVARGARADEGIVDVLDLDSDDHPVVLPQRVRRP